ncbi:carboxypeptidase-like regulatory domain-containing protein [Mucilaginibacter celer]|uniref:Carboxypeptidase-like regulatory domain-containing protein n=1 Tax=Mucilaginibacter celer TaxID=2305508 RepID=A0A494VYT6_9SPHI|nr:carboxypeptidase-like regulatory domain-containing protein [Mucilaginibacter celer]AYL96315.1 hypothetical protein HYN43_013875 [Mucilaginibacter celer]
MAIQHISIPKPCHEQWQQMKPVNGGRYCDHCCKTVTDFTVMSNEEIIKQLSAKDNVCGRFAQHQLDGINTSIGTNKKRSLSWLSVLVASVISLTHSPKAQAQTRLVLEQGEFSRKDKMPAPAFNPLVIQGIVTEQGSGLPIPGTTIRCKNGETTSTNLDGGFKLMDVSETDTLVISFIGYKTQKIGVAAITDKSQLKIEMEPVSTIADCLTVVAGGVWVRHSFVHRLWHKIKNIF